MTKATARFGSSIGPSKPLGEASLDLTLKFAGQKVSVGSSELEDFEFTDITHLRNLPGGLGTDFQTLPLGAASIVADIKHITTYSRKNGIVLTIRLQGTKLDRWNGTAWLAVPGVRSIIPFGIVGAYSTTAQDLFVYANGVDKLTSWDGIDADPVQDLSVDSPIARYITRIGNRIFAAGITVGGIYDPYLCAWCADGNIFDWTSSLAGAGADRPPIEGSDDTPGFIMGISSMLRGIVIYRQNGIQLASLTGVGAAPFRFVMVKYACGTDSPYSIAHGAMLEGDFYLGSNYMVYFFNGDTCQPIGEPILEQIKLYAGGASLGSAFGSIDFTEQEYVLTVGGQTFRFSIREFATTGKIRWRSSAPSFFTSAIRMSGYGYVGGGLVPSNYALLFGDNQGNIHYTSTTPTTGNAETKGFSYGGNEITVSRIRAVYRCVTPGTLRIRAKNSDGASVSTDLALVVPIGTLDNEVVGGLNFTGRSIQFSLGFLSGNFTLEKLIFKVQNRGLTNA